MECGYDLLDRQIADYAKRIKPEENRPVILVAPSWQEDCILDLCADEVIRPLLGRGYRVIVRPHPEYTKRYHARWESLQQRYASYSDDEVYFEQDFSTSDSVYDADVLVTDWSSIACEFSFTTMKPSVFVDTPAKICNPDWKELGIEPTDISIRNQIGVSVALGELQCLGDIADDMISHPETWCTRIEEVRSHMIYHLGRGGEAAGAYLLERMLAKQNNSSKTVSEAMHDGE